MNMQKCIAFFRRNPAWMVAGLWLFFQFLWYLRFGVEFGLEAGKYIDEANYVLQHRHFSQVRYVFYFTTIAIIGLSKTIHIGLYGALLLIMAINLCAYLYFFKALKILFRRTAPALAAVLLLLSFWPYQSWSLYLFTECLFYSLVMVLFAHLLFFKKLTLRFLALCAGWLFLLIISRPLGILFVPPVLLFVFFHLSKRQRLFFVFAGLAFLVLLNFVVQVVFTSTSDWNMARALTEDSIICDMPRANAAAMLDLSNHPNQFYQLFYYVTHNFSHFAGLALVRLRYFFTMVRPYYSHSHNVFVVAYLSFFYGSILWGLKRIGRDLSPAVLAFLVSAVALFAATIALQCDDYHNRFFLTLCPFLATAAVIAWRQVIERLSSFLESRTG